MAEDTSDEQVATPKAAEASPEVDLEAALAQLDSAQLEGLELIINEDGSVTFVDLPPELLDVAYALNPDDPLVCDRIAARQQARAKGQDESSSE